METLTERAPEQDVEGLEQLDCPACVAEARVCPLHDGFKPGWSEALDLLVADGGDVWAEGLVDLVGGYDDDARLVA